MFPDSWNTQTNASRRKRQREEAQDAIQPPPDLPAAGQENLDLPRQILRNINTVSRAPPTPAELDLDVILSRVPYRDILENLFSRERYADVEVPTITRSYEESFMREPGPGERPCVAGEMCECMMIDATNPFVGVEFLLPNEVPGKASPASKTRRPPVLRAVLAEGDAEAVLRHPVHGRRGQRGDPALRQPVQHPGRVRQGVHAHLPPERPGALHAPAHHVPPAEQVHRPHRLRHAPPHAGDGGVRGFCDPLDERAELRIQRLLPLPPRRASVEGGPPSGRAWTDDTEHVFVPGFPDLNRTLGALHAQLQTDEAAQTRIDCHLPAAALALEGCPDYRACVLDPADAPQLAALPDLAQAIRECLMVRKAPASYLASLLPGCMPCPRHTVKPRPAEPASCAVLLNLLLATCLGLYPCSVKRPPFLTRVHLYRRVHALLTAPPQAQRAFVEGHAPLVALALTEYVAFVVPTYLSPVHEALCKAFPVQPFFAQCPAIADAFRQDHIDTGTEPWRALCTAAQAAHDRIARLYKSKCRGVPAPRWPAASEVSAEGVRQALAQHVLVRHPMHRLNEAILQSEYAVLHRGDPSVPVGEIHALVASHPLPDNIHRWQQQVFHDAAQRCLRRAHMRCTKHICMRCERRNKRSALRLCTRTGAVVCKEDHAGTEGCVVGMNAVGTVLRVRRAQYIFAPCCGTVREYLGDGLDFSPPPQDGAPCRHGQPGRPTHRRARTPCAMCELPALAHGHAYLDADAARMTVAHLCQRHTPPDDWLRDVTNTRQFERSCAAWEARMRALYKRG